MQIIGKAQAPPPASWPVLSLILSFSPPGRPVDPPPARLPPSPHISDLPPSPARPPSPPQIFHKVLQDGCVRADGSRALVLDIGANFGYFTVFAAMHGCR